MDFRPATQSDLPGIADVADRSLAASYADVLDANARRQAVESWYGTEPSSPGTLTDEIGDERTVVIVAEDGTGICGFAQAFLSGDDPRVGQIEWLHVHPDYRGKGIGDRLLDKVEGALHDAGADSVEAQVIEANTAGKEFYEQYGYKPETTRQVRLNDEEVSELTLVANDGAMADRAAAAQNQPTAEQAQTVVIANNEGERGRKGPFHPTYRDGDRTQHLGWQCGVCDRLDVSMGTMGEIVCDNCGNKRLPRRWDAAYGG